MPNQFPPELIERGRALRSASPPPDDKGRWKLTWEIHWGLEDLMMEVLKDVPSYDRSGVQSNFAKEIGFSHNLVLHHSSTAPNWPRQRRNPAYSYAQHERRNRAAKKARTEEDWARIWDEPIGGSATLTQLLEQLQDPEVMKALRGLAAGNKKARLEEAARIAETDQEDLERAAKREWAKADKERQRLEKLGLNNANDFYIQASTRLAKLPMEVHAVQNMAQFVTPYMRGELLKLADRVMDELKRTTTAVKDIDKIAAIKAKAARTDFEAEAAVAQAHADRLANGRARTPYGVSVNLQPAEQTQGEHPPTELPSSSGTSTKPK